MTALGINMTDKDKEYGWADIQPTHHPVDPLLVLALDAWKLAAKMVDEHRDWDDIKRLQETAQELENMARSGDECKCVLPEQSCPVCRATARVVYEKEHR